MFCLIVQKIRGAPKSTISMLFYSVEEYSAMHGMVTIEKGRII